MEVSKMTINGQTVYDRKEDLTKRLDLATSKVSVAKTNYEKAKNALADFKENNEELLNEFSGLRREFNGFKNELADALLEYYVVNNELEGMKE